MTTRATARHRAEVTKTNSLAVIAKTVGDNAGGMGRQAAVIAAASGMVLTSGIAANAAETNVQRESTSASALEVQSSIAPATISAASTIAISYEKPAVSTTPAPVVAKPVVKVQSSNTGGAQAATAGSATAGSASAKAPAAVGSGSGASIAAAAYAQLGVAQDCTALATNALAAVGVHYHGWPAGYLSLGRTVSAAEAKPGDLAYYANGGMGMAHIAVYVGNGTAVHGGWNGGTTALSSVNVGSGPVFIRVGG